MLFPASMTRESTTRSSSFLQKGHCMVFSLPHSSPAVLAGAAVAVRRFGTTRKCRAPPLTRGREFRDNEPPLRNTGGSSPLQIADRLRCFSSSLLSGAVSPEERRTLTYAPRRVNPLSDETPDHARIYYTEVWLRTYLPTQNREKMWPRISSVVTLPASSSRAPSAPRRSAATHSKPSSVSSASHALDTASFALRRAAS